MIKLSAFADEISPDLEEQIALLGELGIDHLDLRSVWGVNVLDLDDGQVAEVRARLGEAGIGVACIGSPVGKVGLTPHPLTPSPSRGEGEPTRGEGESTGGEGESTGGEGESTTQSEGRHAEGIRNNEQRLRRALELAGVFGTRFVRIFSFYPPAEDPPPVDWGRYRDEVIGQLRQMTACAAEAGVTLLHENDRDLYGDVIERCVDVLASVGDPHLQAAFDPANFIQCGERPYPDAYEALRPWIRYVHVKDAARDGKVVAAGEGEARWPEILAALRRDGYDGFFSLEPHLAAAGKFQGFSGPELFKHAVRSFQSLAPL